MCDVRERAAAWICVPSLWRRGRLMMLPRDRLIRHFVGLVWETGKTSK
jgi:hypothetical protein